MAMAAISSKVNSTEFISIEAGYFVPYIDQQRQSAERVGSFGRAAALLHGEQYHP
jgi:hypothetical protein